VGIKLAGRDVEAFACGQGRAACCQHRAADGAARQGKAASDRPGKGSAPGGGPQKGAAGKS
jgi:hypothetical protein